MILPPMPPRIAALPQDERGYPIPWNVMRRPDGTAIFTLNDTRKHLVALLESLCPICGGKLGKFKWFVGGPKSAFDPDGWYHDLPGHRDCIEFALQTCPYLAVKNYAPEKPLLERVKIPAGVTVFDPTQERGRPLLFVMLSSEKIEMHANGNELPFVRPVHPVLAIQFWQHGKRLGVAEGVALVKQVMG